MDRAEHDRIEQVINREVVARFPAGSVRRAVLLQHGDDPVIEPGELLVRIFIAPPGGPSSPPPGGPPGQPADDQPASDQRALDAWQQEHQARMSQLRRELSLRLPPARLLEFAVEDASGAATVARITMREDPALLGEPMPPREAVAAVLRLLRERYVFPERAEQAAAAIEARLAAGEYDDLSDIILADRLTRQLHEACADKHLRVRLRPQRPLPAGAGPQIGPPDPGTARQPRRKQGQLDNFGIHRVERLDGNIGYLDLRRVAVPENAGPAIAAAMELVSGTEALIIDLRQNGGGSPDGAAFWCSYFFRGSGTHLNSIYHRETGLTRQFWTLPYVPGSRYLGRPVYLLASADTFSGGEDICYALQAQGRAQVIGETTGGGAHPTSTHPISPTLAISVPDARSVNPVTGTNWEGTGVVPDIPVPAAEAHDVAYAAALRHVLTTDVPPPLAEEARTALAGLPVNRDVTAS